MSIFTPIFLFTYMLFNLISPCHAEVQLTHNVLTVDINNTTLKDVLDDIQQQSDLKIVAFEETNIGNVRISKKFWNIPLETALDRLLNGWNYGINRDRVTGKITTLYMVSQRANPSNLPDRLSNLENQASRSNRYASQIKALSLEHNEVNSEIEEEWEERSTEFNVLDEDEF